MFKISYKLLGVCGVTYQLFDLDDNRISTRLTPDDSFNIFCSSELGKLLALSQRGTEWPFYENCFTSLERRLDESTIELVTELFHGWDEFLSRVSFEKRVWGKRTRNVLRRRLSREQDQHRGHWRCRLDFRML